ncbi:MAG: aliphatic sulfonate ABC transporter substrate-binding protein, partial [Actinobacteria bacterium]|nr:aliphatic sulfonate ABC transporter substrate-binding protein [Actinomycetota bacterium]
MIPRHRIRAALVATALAATLALSGCGTSTGNEEAVNDDGSVDLSKVTLIVGDQRSTSNEALLKAAGLDDTEYDIQWQEFTSGPPMLEAANAGAIHTGMVGNTPPIFAAAADATFRIVSATTFTGVGDAILVPKDSPLQSVADLAGKKVGFAEGSSANYNLLAQLDSAGVSYDDIEIQNLQPADALAAFASGHLDAWAVWEPYTSQAEIDEDARVLADGTDLMNGLSFQIASDAALDDPATEAALADYLNRITRAQLWASEHPDEWSKVWAEQTGL